MTRLTKLFLVAVTALSVLLVIGLYRRYGGTDGPRDVDVTPAADRTPIIALPAYSVLERPGGKVVSGRVLKEGDLRPVVAEIAFASFSGKLKTARWHETKTDGLGKFRTDALPETPHAAMVRSPSGWILDSSGDQKTPYVQDQDLILRRGGELSVVVQNARGLFVRGAQVDLEAASAVRKSKDLAWRLHAGSGPTDDEGRARFPGVAADREYRIHVALPALGVYLKSVGSAKVGKGQTEEVAVTLPAAPSASGVVVDSAGQPAVAAEVRYAKRGEDLARWTTLPTIAWTDADGRFHVPVLPALAGQILVVTREGEGYRQPMAPAGQTAITLQIRTWRLFGLAGQIVDATERPVANARVFLSTPENEKREMPPLPKEHAALWRWVNKMEHGASPDPLRAVCTTDENGRFRVPMFADQPLNLRADTREHDLSAETTVVPGAARPYRVSVRARPSVTVRVLGTGGKPFRGALVAAVSGAQRSDTALIEPVCYSRRMTPTGEVRLTGLHIGQTLLFAFNQDGTISARRDVILEPGQDLDAGTLTLPDPQARHR